MTKKESVALVSLIASLALTIAKLIVGTLIGSLALITDALHSFTDSIATLITLVTVRMADRPPDDDHPYGHGKYENIAALAEAVLLLLLAGGVGVEAWNRFGAGAPAPDAGWLAFGVIGIEIVINGWRAYVLHKTAVETGSRALAADALHFLSDMGSSVAVIGGLVGALYGFDWADPLSAAAIAVFVAVLALRMIKHTVDELTDRVSPGLIRGLRRAIADLPGVVEVNHLRVRTVGSQSFVDASANVPRTFAFEQIGTVKQQIGAVIAADLPGAEIMSSCNPVAMDDETVRERVLLAATREGQPVHHVTIQHLGDRLSIALDLEVDGDLPLGTAHEIASQLEAAIRAEIGADIEVETHLEPLFPDLMPGADLPGLPADMIVATLKSAADENGVSDIHNVRVRELGEGGLFVAFHCRFAPSLLAAQVHLRADAVERAAREKFPDIRRIVSHPEPLRT